MAFGNLFAIFQWFQSKKQWFMKYATITNSSMHFFFAPFIHKNIYINLAGVLELDGTCQFHFANTLRYDSGWAIKEKGKKIGKTSAKI